ncbi:nuclear transport factor 2 family protein [Actinokineospora sp.]|uniref:nuclear transport factor 2 family protein n=1 Tax=Actinokineospora sp. TaxID=1872133 RepID=UPI003D6BD0A1
MSASDPATVVEQYVDAYNSGDNDKLLGLCDEKIQVVHHNREVTVDGREAFGELLGNFAGAFPDKHFESRRGKYADGENVLVEHTWVATAAVDVPGWANVGETVRLDLCTRYTVRDGLIVEYHDYG